MQLRQMKSLALDAEPDSDDGGSHAEAEKTVLPPKRQPSEAPSLMDSGIPHRNPLLFRPKNVNMPSE